MARQGLTFEQLMGADLQEKHGSSGADGELPLHTVADTDELQKISSDWLSSLVEAAAEQGDVVTRKENTSEVGVVTNVDPSTGRAKVKWDQSQQESEVDPEAIAPKTSAVEWLMGRLVDLDESSLTNKLADLSTIGIVLPITANFDVAEVKIRKHMASIKAILNK